MEPKDIEMLTVDLCPRCGMQHVKLEFTKLRSPVTISFCSWNECSTMDLTLWAICPTLSDPILARVLSSGEVEVR